MTIAYNLGIPASGNNPSTDQPNMLTNNDNIPTLIAVDHVNFNTSGSGQHNQVTFHANNPPAVPTVPPVLFTNTSDGNGNALPAGLTELFFYSGADVKGQKQYLSQANGSTLVLGGIILKWGFASGLADNANVSFANAFPNNCFAVQVSPVFNTTSARVLYVKTGSLTTTQFTIRTDSGGMNLYYLAIGN